MARTGSDGGHTPAPWIWEHGNLIAAEGSFILRCNGESIEVSPANAAVVAASPDLVAAAQTASEVFRLYAEGARGAGQYTDRELAALWNVAVTQLDAALAKVSA